MDAGMQSEFNDLCFHWDEVYEIKFDEDTGTWSARYKSAFDRLTAASCDELRQAIRIDYQERRLAEQRALARLQERSSI
jgi:hypothetical protein